MKRETQIELMNSAEERTLGYLQTWMENPAFKEAVARQDRPEEDQEGQHYVAQVRKHA